MAILLGLILAVLVCWFGVYLLTLAWRILDALVQAVQVAVRFIWHVGCASVRAAIAFGRWLHRTDDAIGRRAHAVWWSYSYWLKRAYIASALRARRREGKL